MRKFNFFCFYYVFDSYVVGCLLEPHPRCDVVVKCWDIILSIHEFGPPLLSKNPRMLSSLLEIDQIPVIFNGFVDILFLNKKYTKLNKSNYLLFVPRQ
jgi:hypothetical protein